MQTDQLSGDPRWHALACADLIYRTSTGVPSRVAGAETFTLLAVCEWFNVLDCLSDRRSALSLRLFHNPWLLGGLVVGNHTVPFGIEQVISIGVVGSLVLWADELRKLVVRARTGRRPATQARWEPATR